MSIIEFAKNLAIKAHEGQFRKGGKPYITHPEAVALMLEQRIPVENKVRDICIALGWAHDVAENTNILFGELRERMEVIGFSTHDVYAFLTPLALLTHVKSQTYLDYIMAVKTDSIATTVKLADICHNMSDLKPGHQLDKYQIAYYILTN